MISYAQNFEDVILQRIFAGRQSGFYVDIGAADPEQLSVTKWFYDQGWSGINVDPNPFFHHRLVDARPRDINLMCGAGTANSTALFFELPFKELSSFDVDVRDKAIARGERVVEHQVEIIPLNTILERHGDGRQIDFLKIDTEGWERNVLSSIDLSLHRPTVILVEATEQSTQIPNFDDWEHLLASHGFSCVYFDGLNRFYLGEENQHLKTRFELPPNIFDGFVTAEIVKLRYEAEQSNAKVSALDEQIRQSEEGTSALNALLLQSKSALDEQMQHSEKEISALNSRLRHLEADRNDVQGQLTILSTLLKESEADRYNRLLLLEKASAELLRLQSQDHRITWARLVRAAARRLGF